MAEFFRLKKNQSVELADGRTVTVTDKLGEGGQGVVYRVRFDTGEERALKWFFVGYLKEPHKFYNQLEANIRIGAPSDAFLWPEQLTKFVAGEPFGYVMKIYPKGYESFAKFLLAKVQFKNAAAMVDAALNMVNAFKRLHNKGYNYQDLNDGNFSINPLDGKILICDNDNVVGYGAASGILGKARYMAPEIVRGDKTPDTRTDEFSLAVVLFLLLIGYHPLEGKRTNYPVLTNKYEKRIYGTEPLFIFDEHDNSNAPHPTLHKYAPEMWQALPSFVRKIFQRAFSQESLLDGKTRPLEQDWFHVLVRLKSSIVRCPHCGEEIFLESDAATACPNCKKSVKSAGYLKFNKRANQAVTVPIFKDAVLYDYHMDSSSENFETAAALVLAKPGKFGLQNNSQSKWIVTAPDGRSFVRQTGETQVLSADCKIEFGKNTSAQVIVNN